MFFFKFKSPACINNSFAQCDASNKFVLTQCGAGTICAALPLVNKAGTSIACTTEQDRDSRISTALGTSGTSGNSETTSSAPSTASSNTDTSKNRQSTSVSFNF